MCTRGVSSTHVAHQHRDRRRADAPGHGALGVSHEARGGRQRASAARPRADDRREEALACGEAAGRAISTTCAQAWVRRSRDPRGHQRLGRVPARTGARANERMRRSWSRARARRAPSRWSSSCWPGEPRASCGCGGCSRCSRSRASGRRLRRRGDALQRVAARRADAAFAARLPHRSGRHPAGPRRAGARTATSRRSQRSRPCGSTSRSPERSAPPYGRCGGGGPGSSALRASAGTSAAAAFAARICS